MKGTWDYYSDYYTPGPAAAPGTYSAENFARNMEALLEMKEMTQAEASKICGISQPAFSSWLQGICTPNVYSFALICDRLGIEPNWMLSKHERIK